MGWKSLFNGAPRWIQVLGSAASVGEFLLRVLFVLCVVALLLVALVPHKPEVKTQPAHEVYGAKK